MICRAAPSFTNNHAINLVVEDYTVSYFMLPKFDRYEVQGPVPSHFPCLELAVELSGGV